MRGRRRPIRPGERQRRHRRRPAKGGKGGEGQEEQGVRERFPRRARERAPARHGLPLRCAAAAGCATSARAVPLLHTPSCFWARVERGQRRATSGRLLIAQRAQHLGSVEHTILGATAVVTRGRSYFALRRSPLGWALGPLRCQGSPNAVHDPPALPGERGRARSLCRVRGAMPPEEALTDCAVYVLVHRGGARRQVGKRTPRERLYPPHCPRLASGAELHAISAATSPRF